MPQVHPTISTHILDMATGRPAVGIAVRCSRIEGDAGEAIGAGVTDEDGRIHDLLGDRNLAPGRYRLEFDLGPGRYFEAATVDVRIDDAGRSHHVPLLLAPYGLTTYRGS